MLDSVNDILSVKKEVVRANKSGKDGIKTDFFLSQAQGQVETLVPLLFLKHRNAQTAVDEVVEMLQSLVERFEHATKQS